MILVGIELLLILGRIVLILLLGLGNFLIALDLGVVFDINFSRWALVTDLDLIGVIAVFGDQLPLLRGTTCCLASSHYVIKENE